MNKNEYSNVLTSAHRDKNPNDAKWQRVKLDLQDLRDTSKPVVVVTVLRRYKITRYGSHLSCSYQP